MANEEVQKQVYVSLVARLAELLLVSLLGTRADCSAAFVLRARIVGDCGMAFVCCWLFLIMAPGVSRMGRELLGRSRLAAWDAATTGGLVSEEDQMVELVAQERVNVSLRGFGVGVGS